MRLGGPIFVKSDDPAVLAKAHRDLGYRAAYAPGDFSVNDTDRIAGLVKEFARQDVAIAEVGAWKNMLDPDPVKRKDNVTYVTGKLALAEMLGARNCVDIAGSYDPNVWFGQNPGNLSQGFVDATVENCRKLIDAVKPKRTFFSIEMMPWSFPTDPDEYVKLVKAVDRKAFGVHLDVSAGPGAGRCACVTPAPLVAAGPDGAAILMVAASGFEARGTGVGALVSGLERAALFGNSTWATPPDVCNASMRPARTAPPASSNAKQPSASGRSGERVPTGAGVCCTGGASGVPHWWQTKAAPNGTVTISPRAAT